MCTVSIVPAHVQAGVSETKYGTDRKQSQSTATPSGMRMACNRDELRTRPAALPPSVHTLGNGRQAVWPEDPLGSGTWVGMNDAGLVATLLNGNPDDPEELRAIQMRLEQPMTRGNLVPAALTAERAIDALDAIQPLVAMDKLMPFHLVVTDGAELLSYRYSPSADSETSAEPIIQWFDLDRPRVFSSSGLGDEQVQQPRAELFNAMVIEAKSTDWLEQQAMFHRHQWDDRPEISVMTERDDARTVSHTIIDWGFDETTLTYQPVGETDDDHEPVRISLPRRVESESAAGARSDGVKDQSA